MLKPVALFALLALVLSPAPAHADGSAVCGSNRRAKGGCRIFTKVTAAPALRHVREGVRGMRPKPARLCSHPGRSRNDPLSACAPKASFLVIPRMRRCRTTLPDPAEAALPDLVGQDFTAERPATTLVGDITAIDAWEGRVVHSHRAGLFLEGSGRIRLG